MVEEDTHDLLVLGCAYTPHYGDESEETTLFRHEEMNVDFTRKLRDLPVYIEHDTRHQIGKVVDSFVNENRQVKAMLHITGNKQVNEMLPATLYKDPVNGNKGYYNALSLGNAVGFVKDEEDKIRVVDNVPSEISVCMNGNRPMTEIDDYWFIPKGVNVHDFIRETIEPTITRF